MGIGAWLTLAVVLAIFIALAKNWAAPDVLFLGGTGMLALLRVITPEQAFAGFANSGVLTVALLFVVAAGLRETGVLDYVGHYVLGAAGPSADS